MTNKVRAACAGKFFVVEYPIVMFVYVFVVVVILRFECLDFEYYVFIYIYVYGGRMRSDVQDRVRKPADEQGDFVSHPPSPHPHRHHRAYSLTY